VVKAAARPKETEKGQACPLQSASLKMAGVESRTHRNLALHHPRSSPLASMRKGWAGEHESGALRPDLRRLVRRDMEIVINAAYSLFSSVLLS